MPPDASLPRPETGAGEQSGDQAARRAQSTWLAGELAAIVEVLHAAHLSAKAGHVPAVHLRRAAVRLAALDAAVADDPST